MSRPFDPDAYVRQLEDACLFFYNRITPEEQANLMVGQPELQAFLALLHRQYGHGPRANVWIAPKPPQP